MFSCLVAGRLPLSAPQQVDETHVVFPLENAQDINHVTVFMTGEQAFPPGYSATVHFLWPGEGKQWMLLGCLKNTKPSAIFRLRGSAVLSGNSSFSNTNGSANMAALVPVQNSVTATLGISIEPDNVVDAQIAILQAQAAPAHPNQAALQLAPKIAKNAFSYLSSFAPDSAPQTVPLLQKWLQQLERKLQSQGPSFLDKQD